MMIDLIIIMTKYASWERMNMGRLLEGAMQTLRRLQEDTLRSEEEMKDFEETLKTKDM